MYICQLVSVVTGNLYMPVLLLGRVQTSFGRPALWLRQYLRPSFENVWNPIRHIIDGSLACGQP